MLKQSFIQARTTFDTKLDKKVWCQWDGYIEVNILKQITKSNGEYNIVIQDLILPTQFLNTLDLFIRIVSIRMFWPKVNHYQCFCHDADTFIIGGIDLVSIRVWKNSLSKAHKIPSLVEKTSQNPLHWIQPVACDFIHFRLKCHYST